eukprot:4553118-Prymnesium_polylepis.1
MPLVDRSAAERQAIRARGRPLFGVPSAGQRRRRTAWHRLCTAYAQPLHSLCTASAATPLHRRRIRTASAAPPRR